MGLFGHTDGLAEQAKRSRTKGKITVADPAMGGQGGRPPLPIDQNLGLALAARLRHGGKFLLKSLTFGHFFV